MTIKTKPVPEAALRETERYHDFAMSWLNEKFAQHQENLRKRGDDIDRAAVLRKHWREAMLEKFGMWKGVAWDVEQNLKKLGLVTLTDMSVKPVLVKPEVPEPRPSPELDITRKFFCQACKKFKGIPADFIQYSVGDRLNYIPARSAINKIGRVENIRDNWLDVRNDSGQLIELHKSSTTPLWAPTPLTYNRLGQCWCDIDPAYLSGGSGQ